MEGLLTQALILVGSSTVIVTIFHYLKIPTIVGFILSGIIIGPYGLRWVDSVPGAEAISEIGIIFLMFTIGLEFSREKLRHLKRPFVLIGMNHIWLTIFVIAGIYLLLVGLSWQQSILYACLVTLSSTAIVMKMLEQKREAETPHGSAVFGVLLAQDLAVIPIMLALPLLKSGAVNTFQLEGIGFWLLKIVGVFLVLYLVGRFAISYLFRAVIHTRSKELFFFAVFILCFGVAEMMDLAGLSLSFGAFLAGILIAESQYAKQATADIIPLRDNFLGLFFASAGMLVDLTFVVEKFHWIILTLLVVCVTKSVILYSISRYFKYTKSTSLHVALMLFQIGEFSFVIADLGLELGIMTSRELQFFMSVSILSMMLTPFIIDLIPKLIKKTLHFDDDGLREAAASHHGSHISNFKSSVTAIDDTSPENVIVIGYGVAGRSICDVLGNLDIRFSVIDQNYEVVKRQNKKGMNFIFGDASSLEILESAGLDMASLVIISVSSKINSVIIERVKHLRPDVEIIVRAQYEREAEYLSKYDEVEIVVAEHETTIELVARTLSIFGVNEDDIHALMSKTRKTLRGKSPYDELRKRIDLPQWQALGSIKPLAIRENFGCIGKSLAEIDLRSICGVSILAVYRDGLGTTVPGGDFVVEKGDVLHVIGDRQHYDDAKVHLIGTSIV